MIVVSGLASTSGVIVVCTNRRIFQINFTENHTYHGSPGFQNKRLTGVFRSFLLADFI